MHHPKSCPARGIKSHGAPCSSSFECEIFLENFSRCAAFPFSSRFSAASGDFAGQRQANKNAPKRGMHRLLDVVLLQQTFRKKKPQKFFLMLVLCHHSLQDQYRAFHFGPGFLQLCRALKLFLLAGLWLLFFILGSPK